ncbi:MAG TPA: hypothetical protein VFV19_00905 [Candidatus Polarisedimenticolaceae bacterium]|nr:hypothetical protein [Candidatus Polarisedimenticolaceae bacterium]
MEWADKDDLVRRGVRFALVVAIVVASARVTRAQVLTTITLDGNMADWAPILSDPNQKSIDGPAPGAGVDRDAPVGSTGRDLTGFAWTWDSTYLYFYVSRAASDSNRQRFWYYLDTNEDNRMATGEYVVGVSWQGSNRSTDIELYRYNAVAAGAGDSLGDANGFADGYDMPGSVTSLGIVESGTFGAANGVEMESRIAWSRLGVAAGTPVRFHVAASNGTNIPMSVQDNMGGPGGLVGTTRIVGVRLDPDRAITTISPGQAIAAHVATNLGSNTDTINFSWTVSGALVPTSVVLRADTNGNGVLDAGEPLLTDTDGDGRVDTGALAKNANFSILAVATIPGAQPDGRSCTLTITASSSKKPSITDPATDTITIATPSVTLVKSVDRATAKPGDVLTYSITYTGGGSASALAVTVTDPVPAQVAYVAGSASGAGTTITYSHDGGTTYDASDAAPVTNIKWVRTSPLAPGGSGTASFRAAVR